MTLPTYSYSGVVYTAPVNGTDTFALVATENAIGYLQPSHIRVRTTADSGFNFTTLVRPGDWDFNEAGTSVVLAVPVDGSVDVVIDRQTPVDQPYVTFSGGTQLSSSQLQDSNLANLYINQERADQLLETIAQSDAAVAEVSGLVDELETLLQSFNNTLGGLAGFAFVADVASIPGAPDDADAVAVVDSTGIESFTPLTGVPVGFVGDAGLTAKILYNGSGATWEWVTYEPNDPDDRYLAKTGDGAAIKAAYEGNANTNAFTDAEKAKLAAVEAGATADQSAGEIKTAYESNANTNAFTDAEKVKLAGVESGATADQTGAEIKALYEGEANTNAFTDAEKTKLAGVESGATADQTATEIQALLNGVVDATSSDHTLVADNVGKVILMGQNRTLTINQTSLPLGGWCIIASDSTTDLQVNLGAGFELYVGINAYDSTDNPVLFDSKGMTLLTRSRSAVYHALTSGQPV